MHVGLVLSISPDKSRSKSLLCLDSRIATSARHLMKDQMPARSADFVYNLLLLFWRIIINIFFREIRPRGAYNIPQDGPVILVAAPHANQFLDSFLLMSEVHRETGRKVETLIAAKSMRRKFVGSLAKCMSVIPVERAADNVRTGSGFITLSDEDARLVLGYGTRFTTEFRPKSQIMLPKGLNSLTAEVVEIISDTELKLKKEFWGGNEKEETRVRQAILQTRVGDNCGLTYKCVPHVDQQEMYRFVNDRLKNSACIGIFPEGGSHDRTDLLPLKVGATIMALGAMASDPSIHVKLVPVGLSYFHPHKFRSRAVIEFGSTMDVPPELVELFKKGGVLKRQACAELLDLIYKGLKTVTVRAPDYETLMVIQAARRLYRISGQHLTLSQVVGLNKRFLEAYLYFKDEPRVKQLKQEVLRYNRSLRDLGLRDHQVPRAKLDRWKAIGLLGHRLGVLMFWSTLALPGVILNGIIFILAKIISHKKAKEALAESNVKVAGRDALGSWKVIVSLVVTPVLYSVYALAIFVLMGKANAPVRWTIGAPLLTFVMLPVVSYATLKFGEAGMDIFKSLQPLIISLLPGGQRRLDKLKQTREELSNELVELITDLAPRLWQDFNIDRVPVPSTYAIQPKTNISILSRRRTAPRASSAQGMLLTHPMSWLDEHLFGWSSGIDDADSLKKISDAFDDYDDEEFGDREDLLSSSPSNNRGTSSPDSN